MSWADCVNTGGRCAFMSQRAKACSSRGPTPTGCAASGRIAGADATLDSTRLCVNSWQHVLEAPFWDQSGLCQELGKRRELRPQAENASLRQKLHRTMTFQIETALRGAGCHGNWPGRGALVQLDGWAPHEADAALRDLGRRLLACEQI